MMKKSRISIIQSTIKNMQEISAIEKACKLGEKLFDYVLAKIKPNVSEKQVVTEIMNFIKENNTRVSFRPIVAFGKNSFEPHHKPNETKLKKGDLILLDFGVKVDNYCSDMTRTVFMGKTTLEQKKIYQTVLIAQQKTIEFLNKYYSKNVNSILGKHVDKIAREYIIKSGYPPMPHGLGHGIGRKIHEPPKLSSRSKHVLRPGMVFSLEPGIYISGFGGVRIEDLVVLEKNGPKILTHFSKEIIEL